MRIAVISNCKARPANPVLKALDEVHAENAVTQVVHSDCAGAPAVARFWARKNKLHSVEVATFFSNYPTEHEAWQARNDVMISLKPELVLLFGEGPSVDNLRTKAKIAGIPTKDIP